jgi:iron complex outermembrane receptor protein
MTLVVPPALARTTVRLLYGEAFRAPSAAEALLTAGVYVANPSLSPERISTTEINVQQRLSDALLLGVSAYRYAIDDLIDQQSLGVSSVGFENLSNAKATGLELQLDARPADAISAQFGYVLQKTTDAQGTTLTNSPQQLATLGVTARTDDGLRGAAQLRYESGRRTLAAWTSPFFRTDTNLGYRPGSNSALSWFGNAEASLRVTNLFDVAYATPAGSGNRQDSIAADGRTYALRLDWHF